MASDAAIRARWSARLRTRKALLAHAQKQVSYWVKKRDKARNPSPARAHARHMLEDRRALVKARRKQVATAQKVIARHAPKTKGVSDNCVALVARFEGFVDHVYRDAVGVETVGYGETRRDIIAKYRGGHIPEADARALLRERLSKDYAPPVLRLNLPTQNAIDATVSLVYNCGPGCIAPGTTIGDALRRKDWHAAANGFLLWDKAGGQRLPGLTRRRQEERALFLKSIPI